MFTIMRTIFHPVAFTALTAWGVLGCAPGEEGMTKRSTSSSAQGSQPILTSEGDGLPLPGKVFRFKVAVAEGSAQSLACVPLSVQALGEKDQIVLTESAILVTLSEKAEFTGQFYASSVCGKELPGASVEIPAGESSAKVYYLNEKPVTTMVTATFNEAIGTGEIVLGPPTIVKLALDFTQFNLSLNGAGDVPLNTCTMPLYAYLSSARKAEVVYSLTMPLEVPIKLNNTTGRFYLDPGCTMLTNQAILSPGESRFEPLYFRATAAGMTDLSFSGEALKLTAEQLEGLLISH